jgi:hypothetical protein
MLNNSFPELLNPGDIDHMVSFITQKIQEVRDLSVLKVHPIVFRYILPERIRLLIRLQNARRRQWQQTRSPFLGSVVSIIFEFIGQFFLQNNVFKLYEVFLELGIRVFLENGLGSFQTFLILVI